MHNFLKIHIGKYVSQVIKWDHLLALITLAYNKISPGVPRDQHHYAVFVRDKNTPLSNMLKQPQQYEVDSNASSPL